MLFLLIALGNYLESQVSISKESRDADPSAMVDIYSEQKGLLIPRVNLSSSDNPHPITDPEVSLMVYNKAEANDIFPGYYYWDGSSWIRIGDESEGNVYEGVSFCNGIAYTFNGGTPYTFTNNSGSTKWYIIKAWGAGGGGYSGNIFSVGGGGAFVGGRMRLNDGETLTIYPGEGGPIAGGGGATVIYSDAISSLDGLLLVAAGGGGSGGGHDTDNSSGMPYGGAGGAEVGQAGGGMTHTHDLGCEATGGGGGTQNEGGAPGVATGQCGTGSNCEPGEGGFLEGGYAKAGTDCQFDLDGSELDRAGQGRTANQPGGTGGSGFYGGGGGASVGGYIGAGGGGGSSYLTSSQWWKTGHKVGGNGQIPGMTADPCYNGAGLGGHPGTRGVHGMVVIIEE